MLAFIPQENPEKLLGDVKVISAWLSKQVGVPVRGFVTSDHAAAVEALRNGDADISFLGALPYVIANAQVGATVVLAEVYRGKPIYTGRIFVHRDSGIENLADLKGKAIAFADPISESGYLYPLDTFVEQGLLHRGGGGRQASRHPNLDAQRTGLGDQWPHPMHLHCHSFRVISRDGKPTSRREWQDTVLIERRERTEIAFVADNSGDWMFHCHILEHMLGGMMGVIRVA